MKKKFIQIFLLLSIVSLSFIKGDTHILNMVSTNMLETNTPMHCSQDDVSIMKKHHDLCDFVCHLIFEHKTIVNTKSIAYHQNLFYFNTSFSSLYFNHIFKPPIYT